MSRAPACAPSSSSPSTRDSRNRTIALCGMREEVTEIFEISGLLELFTIHDSVEAAVAALPQ